MSDLTLKRWSIGEMEKKPMKASIEMFEGNVCLNLDNQDGDTICFTASDILKMMKALLDSMVS
jgi:hypothetical protein